MTDIVFSTSKVVVASFSRKNYATCSVVCKNYYTILGFHYANMQ